MGIKSVVSCQLPVYSSELFHQLSTYLKAYAKINLNLYIKGKLPNGYHELSSDVLFAKDLYDEIEIINTVNSLPLTGGGLGRGLTDQQDPHPNPLPRRERGLSGSPIKDNIIDKAIYLMKEKFSIKDSFSYTLTKNIPIAAGLGGGSADAAATLRWFNDKYKLNLSLEELAEIGLELGADVPACIYSKPLNFSSIGEIIKPIDNIYKNKYILLVNPNISVSTKDVFKLVDLEQLEGENHLTKFACQLEPKIKECLNLLKTANRKLQTGMSGSGATCFAIFDAKEQAKQLQKTLPTSYWSFVSVL